MYDFTQEDEFGCVSYSIASYTSLENRKQTPLGVKKEIVFLECHALPQAIILLRREGLHNELLRKRFYYT